VTYQRIGDTVEFELSAKAGWAGVGFSDDRNMVSTSPIFFFQVFAKNSLLKNMIFFVFFGK